MDDGKALRDAGIAIVTANNISWMDHALATLRGWLAFNQFVTIEEFRSWWFENGGSAPKHHNAWGALGRVARERGLLETAGYVKARSAKTHAHPVAQYRSVVFIGRAA